jgi:hypothetical protein
LFSEKSACIAAYLYKCSLKGSYKVASVRVSGKMTGSNTLDFSVHSAK